jgi:Protein of unknown function (DUF3759)
MPFGWGKLTESIVSPSTPLHLLTASSSSALSNTDNLSTGESQQAYDQVNSDDFNNQSSFGHEALAGAASFGAFKIFEDRQRKEGTFFSPFKANSATNIY